METSKNTNNIFLNKHLMLVPTLLLLMPLAACSVPESVRETFKTPLSWTSSQSTKVEAAKPTELSQWWKSFHDEQLNSLIDQALAHSPDVKIAAAKIAETRGLFKTADAQLMPEVTAGAGANRQRSLFLFPITGNNGNADFDASYELDLFGKNRSAAQAADAATRAAQGDYEWVKISLVAEVARNYIDMRAAEKQIRLAQKNLKTENETLELVDRQHQAGGTSEFDKERTALLVSQSQAQIADYQRQKEVYGLSLMTLTGLSQEELATHLAGSAEIPAIDARPAVLAPADVMANRPDILAANARLEEATSLTKSEAASVFPTISVGGMFGIAKTALVNTTSVWTIGANAAVSVLDFGRIQGRIDAASARETQAYELWRKSMLQAVQDVETSLTNVGRIQQQRVSLEHARDHATRAFSLAQVRYKAGDTSLLDVLDAQRQVIESDSQLINTEAQYAAAVIALYKALGQY